METLRNYLESMFKRYPETEEADKAKAELWQMMEDKYNELLADGKKENEAVGIVISEFGDLEEVADSLGISTMLQRIEQPAGEASPEQATSSAPAKQAAQATQNGRAVEAETIPPTPVLTFGQTEAAFEQAAAERSAFADQAAAEAFGTDSQQSDSGQQDGERSGAWWNWHNIHSAGDEETGSSIYQFLTAAQSVFWPTVTCLYLIWSFLTFKWWITWIIWPLAAVLHSLLKRVLLGDMSAVGGRVYKSRLIAAVLDSYWPCVVFVYFALSFLTGGWAITWLIFVIAPFMRNFLKRMATEEGAAKA